MALDPRFKDTLLDNENDKDIIQQAVIDEHKQNFVEKSAGNGIPEKEAIARTSKDGKT